MRAGRDLVAQALVMGMTPAELKATVLALPYTPQEVAEKIGVTRGHLYNCMSGGTSLSRSAEMLLMQLKETK